MPFSLSGRVAAGADDALNQVLQRRLQEAVRLQQEKHQNELIDVQRQQMAQTAQNNAIDNARQQKIVDLGEVMQKNTLERQAKADAEKATDKATAKNAMTDMAGVLAMPGLTHDQRTNEIMGSGLRTNTVDPSKVIEQLNKIPPKASLYHVTVPGPGGKPMDQWIPEDQAMKGVQAYEKPDRPPRADLTAPEAFRYTRELRNDFVKQTSQAKLIAGQYANMKDAMAKVKSGELPAGSEAALVIFNKILDPNSVVRESEYDRSLNGQSWVNQLKQQWQKVFQGGNLQPDALQKYVDLAGEFAKNSDKTVQASRRQIDAIAREWKLDPSLITSDYDYDEPPKDPNAPKKPTVKELMDKAGQQ